MGQICKSASLAVVLPVRDTPDVRTETMAPRWPATAAQRCRSVTCSLAFDHNADFIGHARYGVQIEQMPPVSAAITPPLANHNSRDQPRASGSIKSQPNGGREQPHNDQKPIPRRRLT